MKRIIITFTSLYLGFFSTFSYGQAVYSNKNIEIYPIGKDIFLLKETLQWTANIIALRGDDGILLMDTGFEEASNDLLDAIKYLDSDVKTIIYTHPHMDHVGGGEALGEGLEIIAHRNSMNEIPAGNNKTIAIDKYYTFIFSGMEVNCIPSEHGHSQGDIVIHVPERKIAFLGDLYLSESFPLLRYGQKATVQNAIANLKAIVEELPEDTRLFSGHGKETHLSDLSEYIKMLEETNSIVKTAIDRGMTLNEMKESDLLIDYGQWDQFFSFITKETWIEDIYNSY